MAQLGNIREIVSIKSKLADLQSKQLIKAWELPYEELLSRLSAARFFFTPDNDGVLDDIHNELRLYDGLHCRMNDTPAISELEWCFEYNESGVL